MFVCNFAYICILLINASTRDYVTKQIFRSFNFGVRAFSAVCILNCSNAFPTLCTDIRTYIYASIYMNMLYIPLQTYIHTL